MSFFVTSSAREPGPVPSRPPWSKPDDVLPRVAAVPRVLDAAARAEVLWPAE